MKMKRIDTSELVAHLIFPATEDDVLPHLFRSYRDGH